MFTVKICGLTNLDDARWALEEGADYLGFVLYSKSPRCVTARQLVAIADGLPETVRMVGVFVNEAPVLVKEIAEACGLAAVQLHGDEDVNDFSGLEVPVWRAIRWKAGEWSPEPTVWKPERFLVDAPSPAYGGTGAKADWTAAAAFVAGHRAMLAGGLDPDSVGEAILRVKPLGVDVSSGVEMRPGRKDHKKVGAFIRAARSAAKEAGLENG